MAGQCTHCWMLTALRLLQAASMSSPIVPQGTLEEILERYSMPPEALGLLTRHYLTKANLIHYTQERLASLLPDGLATALAQAFNLPCR